MSAGAMPVNEMRERAADRSRVALWLLPVLAVTLAVYVQCGWHYFYLDDFWHLLTAQQTSWANLWRPWQYTSHDVGAYWFAAGTVHQLSAPAFFRPLVTGLFKVGLALWGLNPAPFHAINIAGQLASTAIVFWLVWRLMGRERGPWPAAFAAAIFGLHPCHYAAVEWIAANADILAAFFGSLSVAAYVECVYRRGEGRGAKGEGIPASSLEDSLRGGVGNGRGWYVLSLVAFLLALGSKEIAVTIPLILVGVEWFMQYPAFKPNLSESTGGASEGSDSRRSIRSHASFVGTMLRRRWAWYLPFALVLTAYVLWRIPAAIGVYSFNRGGGGYLVGLSSFLTIPQLALNFVDYILQFVLLYPVWPVNFAHWGWIAWPAAAAAVAVVILLAWAGSRVTLAGSKPRALYWLGVWWLVVTLGPFSFLAPIQRMAHFPGAGFALVLAGVAMGVWGRLQDDGRFSDVNDTRTRALADKPPVAPAIARTDRQRRWTIAAAAALLIVYAGASAAYAAMMGQVSYRIEQITTDLDAKMAKLPADSQIYLIDLWQPAWMFEHFFSVKYPTRDYHLHVLTFDPNVLPPDVRAHPGPAARWFARWFPKDAGNSRTIIKWITPRKLRISLEGGVFFQGVIEAELPVAKEAQEVGHAIDAGPFVARAAAKNDRGVTALTFQWKSDSQQGETPPKRLFLIWSVDHWRPLQPPPGWEDK